MNYGPLIFLAAFIGLAGSWFGFVVGPAVQLGRLQQTNTLGGGVSYPVARAGMAQSGLQSYRANGCAYCHSQQVTQSGTTFDAKLAEVGTNRVAVLAALKEVHPDWPAARAEALLTDLPKPVLEHTDRERAQTAVKALTSAGAQASLWIVPLGPEIARGWGKRRSIAEDFLFDTPVQPGSQRIGPDLAHAGVRLPDPNWHYRHLYAPRSEVKDSAMPPYRYLFEKRRITGARNPEALDLPPAFVEQGYEVVPKAEAKALVAYLSSLRTDAPLFSAPVTVPMAVTAPTDTNAPAGTTGATNTPSK